MSFFSQRLRVFVRAMLRTFYYEPSCQLSRREGYHLVNNRRYSQIQKQKGISYERSRSFHHNPSSYYYHTISSGYRLHAIFDAQK